MRRIIELYLFFSIFLLFICADNINVDKKNNLYKEKSNSDELNLSNIILEHVTDSYDWHIIGKYKLSLPIILWNNGLEFFSFSNFFRGNVVKGKNGYYKMFKKTIYVTNSLGKLYLDKNYFVLNKIPVNFSITKNVISIFISFLILCFLFINMKNSYVNHEIKWKLGIFLEYIILFIRDEIAIPYIGKEKHETYFPFLLTSFFFILINNLMGIIPGFPNVTGNINITFVLSLITFFIANINSSKSYWKHIFWMQNVPIIVKLLLAPIEFVGILIRPLTLCIRLFANITAGHIIIISFICLIFIFKNILVISFSLTFGLFISILEIMVAFLQAFIFTTLSALFIGTSIKNYENKTH
ncbi:F0F1 ATP synthase subunit A [Blattabacterium cuenoti]|uniref:F0F1 ATP synthase subunit A n=1 Tax=Blattabacterium cuenoti TaxID=1653831 RepID=UPI00163BEE22|nr:F0F1 ATP synthase subunit A [Blattabacterium cuenoti]